MIVGEHTRENDITVNVRENENKQTNIRSANERPNINNEKTTTQ